MKINKEYLVKLNAAFSLKFEFFIGQKFQVEIFFYFSEFVLNDKDIFPYNCEKKEQFILKGLGKIIYFVRRR